jgi:sugar/nucleoside kinase (ribokinase family)
MTKRFDVVGIGHALVDILAEVSEEQLAKSGLTKGSMTLINSDQANTLYQSMTGHQEISGGSAANTLAGLAILGCKTAFIGKVAHDSLGEAFQADMEKTGITFKPVHNTPSLQEPTGSCYVLVTPDAERTMGTSLGISFYIESADLHEDMLSHTHILYLEGYLWDQDSAKQVLSQAIDRTKSSGGKIAFTLSDAFCIERHRQDFIRLIAHKLDIVFANEAELLSLYEITSFDEAVQQFSIDYPSVLGVITRSEKGCVVIDHGIVTAYSTDSVETVVDTTGAGDLFAAGFLSVYSQGKPLSECATLGNHCAAQIIQHYGARPQRDFLENLSFTLNNL